MDKFPGLSLVNETDGSERPHHQALELAAGEALSAAAFDKAYALADRRCRISPPPEAHAYVLRAEAAHRLGDRKSALADLATAVAIAPEDVAANRRLLAWGGAEGQERAARALIATDKETASLLNAIALLRKRGRRSFASVTVLDDVVRGWAVWPRDDRVELTIAGDRERVSVVLDGDAFHPLAGREQFATAFRLTRPRSGRPQTIHLANASGVFFSVQASENESLGHPSPSSASASDRAVTIVVPVYADYPATRRCLDILVRELDRDPRHRAVIVNDAAPDPRMAPFLARVGRHPSLAVLTNERNLGFVASTNRGIEAAGRSDVLLLNADTLPPPGFVDRLAGAAKSSPDIGLVVPLSNNAEFTSFPVPSAANPLPSADEAERLDAIAGRVNAGKVFDIPAGTGFCLYVTRECLDATGGLLESFHRGYLEDVDFCLRAREAGFRTVCDPAVYVGHVGSRSFGAEKSSLVLRNFRILERRFPDYAAECEAWGVANPLRPARAAIEQEAVVAGPPTRLLVAGAGATGVVAHERARRLAAKDKWTVIAAIGLAGGRGPRLSLIGPDGAMPQSMTFDLEHTVSGLEASLKTLAPIAIEIFDPANVPESLLTLLFDLGVPLELFIAGADPFPARAAEATRWRRVADGAYRILAPSPEALEFAASRLSPRNAFKLTLAEPPSPAPQRPQKKPRPRLGIVPVRKSITELRLIGAIADGFRRASMPVVVLGETMDDAALMHDDATFVTGAARPDELAHLSRRHGVGALFAGFGAPLFGHPMTEAARGAGLPVAYLDWSAGKCSPRAGDLPLDPATSNAGIAGSLVEWIGRP
jgi:O-antigen biosynthesis protein